MSTPADPAGSGEGLGEGVTPGPDGAAEGAAPGESAGPTADGAPAPEGAPQGPYPPDEQDVHGAPDPAEHPEPRQPPRAPRDDGDAAEPLSTEQFSLLVGESSRSASLYGGQGNVAVVVNMGSGQPLAEFQQAPLGAQDTAWRHRLYRRLPDHDRMALQLAENHLLVLFGQPGSGRHTTARVHLADVCGSDRLSVLHSAGTGLAQALLERADKYLTRGHGVVLDLGAERPGQAVLEALSLRARQLRSFVVLIVESTGADPGLPVPTVFAHPRPDLKQVLEAHLDWTLKTRRTECTGAAPCAHRSPRRFLQEVLADDRVDRALGAALPVREVVALAGTLAGYLHRDPDELDGALGAWRDRLRPVARNFLGLTTPPPDQAPDPHRQTLRIAYVLSDGLPLSDFIRMGTLLGDEVLPPEHRDETPVRPVFELDLDQLVPPGTGVAAEPDAARSDNPRRVRLAEPELLPVVIEVVWHGLGWLQQPLLRWLRRLATDRLERVGSRAAVIAGHLLRHDFDSVYRDLVRHWARSGSVRERQYAALAVAVAMADGDPWLTERVDRQVAAWATSPSPRLQDSAVRAYSTVVGTRDVPGTLRVLQALGGRAALAPYASIAYATAALFLAADGSGPVSVAIGGWIRSDSGHLRRHAVRALLVLGPFAVGPELPSRPALAHRAMNDPVRRAELELLWRRALTDGAHSGQAWRVLKQWVLAGDEDKELGVFLQELVPTVCPPGLRGRAAFHFRRWARQHPEAGCLHRLLAVFDRPGSTP
ncbi:hypothetical protein [Streptomyces sp. NPDC057877]|uniref:hypothetical protein n=1 Tax=Streptomyces sp. NPDC057877 TaxID=3346269 RepID=UPI0036B5693C